MLEKFARLRLAVCNNGCLIYARAVPSSATSGFRDFLHTATPWILTPQPSPLGLHRRLVCTLRPTSRRLWQKLSRSVIFLSRSTRMLSRLSKTKQKICPAHTMQALRAKGSIAPTNSPAAIYPRERTPRCPLYRRLGGSQSWSGHRG
jgi:hypothetical protein